MRVWPYLFLSLAACSRSSDTVDAAVVPHDGSRDAAPDGAVVHVDDGTPTRQACTSTFGTALTKTFGRMDGYLVAIVPPGNGGCNADSNHLHLQVRVNGAIYDVAVDVDSPTIEDVHTGTRDLPLIGAAWSEGWHPGGLVDYVSLGVHSVDLPLGTKPGLVSEMTNDLASANHVSIYATGYGPDGAHLVHRNGNGHDGVIVTQPLSSPSHMRFLSFTSQSF